MDIKKLIPPMYTKDISVVMDGNDSLGLTEFKRTRDENYKNLTELIKGIKIKGEINEKKTRFKSQKKQEDL